MKYSQLVWEDIYIKANLSTFSPTEGVKEFHIILELTRQATDANEQFNCLNQAVERLMQSEEFKNAVLVFKRYFISDAINLAAFILPTANEAISVVQQPPLNGSKGSLYLYLIENGKLTKEKNGTVILSRNTYSHLYHTQLHERVGNIECQTDAIFGHYTKSLADLNCSLEANCIRTWIYVQNVDVQYKGMVDSRKDYFIEAGLTPETHYIASTGIEGRYIYPEVLMLMDAYAIQGIKKEQINYLKAPTHLNPTYEYGVTFERGTSVDYGDRRQIFISGTASIDNKGEIVHPLDICKQTERTLENIQALLAEADATMNHVAHMIIYLRDTADYEFVKAYMDDYYSRIPRVIVWAPVCRPGWLIEIECMAIREIKNEQFATF